MSEQEFNWVGARAACSSAQVFTSLFISVKDDVEKMNTLSINHGRVFGAGSNSSGRYFAAYRDGNTNSLVEFTLHGDHIEIKTSKDIAPLVVTLTLDNEGNCKLRVDGGECLSQWQVRRMVLEELFFGR
jgi:hypothetical protein